MLFKNNKEPLANLLRPNSLDEILGQKKLIPILQKIKNPISLLFYGPPGSGKTSIARILCNTWKLSYKFLSATSSGVKEIKDLINEADKNGTFCLFLDEIHRFSSSQQDSLLDAVETGKLILIGATTENPAFRINRALLSRIQIFKMEKIEKDELLIIYEKIKNNFNIPNFDTEVLDYFFYTAGGDARKFIGIIELFKELYSSDTNVNLFTAKEILSSQVIQFDKSGENHYDFISAFIKSIRGSDPDAGLFYLSAMLEGGEDPLFIMRRLAIFASEDIGNASISALQLVSSAFDLIEKIGMPEGRILLAQVTVFLAGCPKSNASYRSYEDANLFQKNYGSEISIPLHLRNAPTFLHKKEGNSKDYKYPHDFQNGFIDENYFPDNLKNNPPQFYFPTDRGNDKLLKDRLKSIWEKSGKKSYKD
jgi:putative ATPase